MTDTQVFKVDLQKCEELVRIKRAYVNGDLSFDEARQKIVDKYDVVTPQEFAYGEQKLKDEGVTDSEMKDRMNELYRLFEGVLQVPTIDNLPEGHPVQTYMAENAVIESELIRMEELLQQKKFIKNLWLEVYEKLLAYLKHISRKHNQLFPFLERKGFDRPTAVMWSFDDNVKKDILQGQRYLEADDIEKFLAYQAQVIDDLRDIILKEKTILYPTALQILSENDFRQMRLGEDEIGYANIEGPKGFLPEGTLEPVLDMPREDASFMNEFNQLLQKYKIGRTAEDILDVANGKLTLEQINLIYRHLPIELTYTDENNIVKFYTDAKERIFDRSAGVIGRDLQNCHPREVWPVVSRVVQALRNGEKDVIQFSTTKKGKLIHVAYRAIRDEQGNFRGILETIQDITPFKKDFKGILQEEKVSEADVSDLQPFASDITPKITMAGLFDKYPYLKPFMGTLNPMYKKLQNPVTFAAVGRFVTLEMVANRGGFKPEELLEKIKEEIEKHKS